MKLATVIDGDTYAAVDLKGRRYRIRLQGADCPELHQRNGPQAKHFVHKTVGKRWVKVRLRGKDRYRRHLADVRVEQQDLAWLLVRAGLAYPLGDSWRLKTARLTAWLQRRGVHAGFGQAKPWQGRQSGRWLRTVRYWLKKRK